MAALDIASVGNPTADATLAAAAQAGLRSWWRWLKGLEGSSTPYLLDQVIRRPGRLFPGDDSLLVELEPRPLDVALHVSGYLDLLEQHAGPAVSAVRYRIGVVLMFRSLFRFLMALFGWWPRRSRAASALRPAQAAVPDESFDPLAIVAKPEPVPGLDPYPEPDPDPEGEPTIPSAETNVDDDVGLDPNEPQVLIAARSGTETETGTETVTEIQTQTETVTTDEHGTRRSMAMMTLTQVEVREPPTKLACQRPTPDRDQPMDVNPQYKQSHPDPVLDFGAEFSPGPDYDDPRIEVKPYESNDELLTDELRVSTSASRRISCGSVRRRRPAPETRTPTASFPPRAATSLATGSAGSTRWSTQAAAPRSSD